MSKTLGITMIQMYERMIEDEFAPIMDTLKVYDALAEKDIEVEARKELGIYDMTVKRAKLQMELNELNRQLESIDGKSKNSNYVNRDAPLQKLIRAKKAESKTGIAIEVEQAMKSMINRIKLCGINSEVKETFDELPAVIDKLQKQIKKLPKIKPAKQLK